MIKFLFDDFKEWHPEIKVSYDSYKKEVARMNISFVKLGEEECEDCIMDKNHEHGNIEEGMPAKLVIAGKLMLKGQKFKGSYTKRTLNLNQLLEKHIFL